MKTLTLILITSSIVLANGYRYQQGYLRKNGTYVQGHLKGVSDGNPYNNLNQPSYGQRNYDSWNKKNKQYDNNYNYNYNYNYNSEEE